MSVWLLDSEHIAAMLETAFDLLNGAGSDGDLTAEQFAALVEAL